MPQISAKLPVKRDMETKCMLLKQEKKSAGIRVWFFCTHISLCTLCQWNTLCYCIHCCASACVLQISIAPCSPLPFPRSPRAFLMHLRLALLLVPPHSVEAEIMTWITWLHCRKGKQFLSCCSVSKGKAARDTTLLPLPEGETFLWDGQRGGRYKTSLLSLSGTAWMYCLNIKVMWVLRCTFKLFLPFASHTGLQIKKSCSCLVGHGIALNGEKCVLMCRFLL